MHCAAKNGLSDIVNYLLIQGADIDSRDNYQDVPLVCALDERHAATAKVLIERECDLNFKFHKLLVLAAKRGLKDVLQLLLDKGSHVSMDKVSSSGESPLNAAAWAGKYDIVTFLLERGASVNGNNSSSGCEDGVNTPGPTFVRCIVP